MSLRKLHNETTSQQLSISYLREFSAQACNYNSNKTEESLVLLHRSATMLRTAVPPQHFTAAGTYALDISNFFIDLHAFIGAVTHDSDAQWTCIALLQHCARNLVLRRALVEEYRFLPLLTMLLERTQARDKVQRLLSLLQELTYGMRITWEEPYVGALLMRLNGILQLAIDEGEDQLGNLALSILINLCYKNYVVMCLFRRSVSISQFCRKIENYSMLGNKMLLILYEDLRAPCEKDLHLMLRNIFVSVQECIKTWNVPHLRHIVDFCLDSKSYMGLHKAMLSYKDYCADVERLLDQLETCMDVNTSNEESGKHREICLSLIFRLIRYALELSVNDDNKENAIISLDAIVQRIYELLGNWLESAVCGIEAVNLLEALVRLARKQSVIESIARNANLLLQLIAISENADTAAEHTSAILQLLMTLLDQSKTEKHILSKVTESYFDKILSPLLLAGRQTETTAATMSAAEIKKSILCLLLLINFAGIAKKAYFEKCCTLLKLPQMQEALARAMLSDCEVVCAAVFKISKFAHFPLEHVAKHISTHSAAQTHLPQQISGDQWRAMNTILKCDKAFVSREMEERLTALIELIFKAHQQQELNNVPTSQIIELFQHKFKRLDCDVENKQKRLEAASNETTILMQSINRLNAELERHNTINFQLQIQQESMQTQCKDMQQQSDNLKRNVESLMKKLSEQCESLQISEKRLSVKVSEVIVLQEKYNETKTDLRRKYDECEKLQNLHKETTVRIEKLKKSLAAYELEIKEKTRVIDERERDLSKTHKALEEQKEAKRKSDDVIAALESQLQQKNEQIRNYETELSETEEMRKTIMSLMESKKPKRKA